MPVHKGADARLRREWKGLCQQVPGRMRKDRRLWLCRHGHGDVRLQNLAATTTGQETGAHTRK